MRPVGVGFGLIFLVVANVSAAPAYEFQKILDTSAVVPGINLKFGDLREAVTDSESVAFCGQSFSAFGRNGVYRAQIGGNVVEIATDSTPSPSGGSNFRDMCINAEQIPTIDAGQVAFQAYNNTVQGVYLHDGESLTKVVDDGTTFPGTMVKPLRFEAPSLNDRIAVTWSNSPGSPAFAGIYSFDPALFAVVDTNHPFFYISSGTVGGGSYVWGVNDAPFGPYHVYRRRYAPSCPIELVASGGQQIAGDHFVQSPGFPQADRSDGRRLCFLGGTLAAVYRADGSDVKLVADTNTPIPGGSGNFSSFGLYCSMDAGEVVFQAAGPNQQNGVYIARTSGALEKVIDTSDMLGGETPFQFATSREAISNGRIAFIAYSGGKQAIWVADDPDHVTFTPPDPTCVPEPDGLAAGALAVLVLSACRRRRH